MSVPARLGISKRDFSWTSRRDRSEALVIFGKELGVKLTLEGADAPPYLLDEWEIGPHWVNPTIPVYRARTSGSKRSRALSL